MRTGVYAEHRKSRSGLRSRLLEVPKKLSVILMGFFKGKSLKRRIKIRVSGFFKYSGFKPYITLPRRLGLVFSAGSKLV